MTELVNPRSGERVRVISHAPELLEIELTWPAGRRRTAPHAHPGMEERWEVVSGRAAFGVGGQQLTAGPGEAVVAPPGTPHEAWNAGDEVAVVRVQMRPALRWLELITQLFDALGRDPAGVPALLARYPEEIALPGSGE